MSLGNVINLNRYTAPPQVEYSAVGFVTLPIITGITDVIFDTILGGTIPYNTTTGEWTLTAGKTYQLEARLRLYFSGSSSDGIVYQFVDAVTNIALPGISADQLVTSFVNSNSSSIETTSAIYTPTVTQNVKLRIVGTVLTPSAQLQAGYSGAIVKEIGFSSYVPANRLRAHASLTALAPVVPASPTLAEVQTWALASLAARSDRVVYYTGTDTGTDPITHVYMVDSAGVVTMVRSPGGASSGWDDVLAVGQNLTANRLVNTNGNTLDIQSGVFGVADASLFRIRPADVAMTSANAALTDSTSLTVTKDFISTVAADAVDNTQMDQTPTGFVFSSTQDGVRLLNQTNLKFHDGLSGNTVGFRAGSAIAANVLWTLPTADGAIGTVLSTNGAGVLSWNIPSNINQLIDVDLDTGVFVESTPDSDTIIMRVGDNTGSFNVASPVMSVAATQVLLRTPDALLTAINTANMTFETGSSTIGGSPLSGDVFIRTGQSVGTSGNINLDVGNGDRGGNINLNAGDSNTNEPGNINIFAGDTNNAVFTGGSITLLGGEGIAVGAVGGLVSIRGGDAALDGGDVSIQGGDSAGSIGGAVNLTSGTGQTNGGDIVVTAGSSPTGTGGSILLEPGNGITSGNVVIRPNSGGAPSRLAFVDSTGITTNSIGFVAPNTVTTPTIWQLPAADGAIGTVLSTNGAGVLSWNIPNISRIIDADLDTRIVVEETPDSDVIEMFVGDNAGNFNVAGSVFRAAANGIELRTLNSLTGVPAGEIRINPGSSSGQGGNFFLEGGLGNPGGRIQITSGISFTGNAGDLVLEGGGSFTGNGGSTRVSAGNSSGAVGVGGDVQILGGNNTSTGLAGSVRISGGTGNSVLEDGRIILSVTDRFGAKRPSVLGFESFDPALPHIVGFQAPSTVLADTIWTLPAADGTSGQVLQTNGAGVLSWTPQGSSINLGGTKLTPLTFDGIAQFDPLNATNTVLFLASTGGPITHTGTPFLVANTIVGSTVTLIGCSDTDTLTLTSSTPSFVLNGNITLWRDTVLTMMWIGTGWLETSRNS
jgi:hypothetical protein